MSAVGGNYISDGQIMAWLAIQQDRIYGDLKESMDLAESRADFASELVEIKAHLEEANRSKQFGAVDKELQAFLEKYGDSPEFADVCDSLEPMAKRIHGDWEYLQSGYADQYKDYQARTDTYDALLAGGEALELSPEDYKILAEGRPEEPDAATKSYSDEDIKTWTNLIDDKLDASSKNDQLTMIHIQELKATLDQGTQLASSFIASGDKTTSVIINNIA
ncbi:MAG TPA: hypothetical protein VJN18_22600 [Polyangiaceae bacterium]|nr:hypothetical protein [Polyangiaceae bacterium]